VKTSNLTQSAHNFKFHIEVDKTVVPQELMHENLRMQPKHEMHYLFYTETAHTYIFIFIHFLKGIGSFFSAYEYFAFASLYATLVCVACSQLEKLRASLLDIRQTHVTAQRNRGTQTDLQEAQGQARASQELFRHMQKQLNECIRHHQEIKRYRIKKCV
jgi:hypothetical protein